MSRETNQILGNNFSEPCRNEKVVVWLKSFLKTLYENAFLDFFVYKLQQTFIHFSGTMKKEIVPLQIELDAVSSALKPSVSWYIKSFKKLCWQVQSKWGFTAALGHVLFTRSLVFWTTVLSDISLLSDKVLDC